MKVAEGSGNGISSPALEIIVDDRECHAGVLAELRQMPGVDARVERLKLGDYLVDNRCLFERKTFLDFAASIIDGRLFHQSWRMIRSGCLSALIVEGRSKDLQGIAIRREALQGALVSLSLIYRLPVLRSFDSAETAHLIVYAGNQMMRHRRFGVVGYHGWGRPKTRRRRQLYLLQALPGLGPDRAAKLLDSFGSVEAVMTADADSLQKVAGIGPKIAQGIRDVLREEPRRWKGQRSFHG